MELCLEGQMRYGQVKMRENEHISKKAGTRGSIQALYFLTTTSQIPNRQSLSTWCSLHYTLNNMKEFELEGCNNSEPGRGPLLTSNNSYLYFKCKYPVLVPEIFPCTIHSFIPSTNPSFLLSKHRPYMLPNLLPDSSNSSFCTGPRKTHSLRCVTPVCSPIPVFLPVSSRRNLKLPITLWSV